MNSVYKDICNLPITALVNATYYKYATLFERRAIAAASVLGSGQVYTEACQEKIADAMTKANSHVVSRFDRQRFSM
ncbi:receptor-like protein kinase HSL1 [Trifolium pratense]|uniref:Receptor-like protein kinase HSL1 n=1 Tax=Trifolium pratense TaxID=57577 RepID=A0A2K3NBA7_TRIPR|nr:receptor-like protein kinase HSL1 [Trifolium pratense]